MIQNLINNPEIYLQGSLLVAYPAVYISGVLTGFTPCVYPVIPITVAYIGAHESGSRWNGFALSVIYVLGMAITYTCLGGFAALTGRLFGQIQTNPWIYFTVANICIFMGLSMLGVFLIPIRPPAFLSRLQPEAKGFMGCFFVGIISGLIVGPCTAPVLAVLLTLVATKQNIFLGMSLLFIFALGMGTLLIILGTFAKLITEIPKSGKWMVTANKIFGWILIGIGEYFLIKAGALWI